jgi:hypothetical protein
MPSTTASAPRTVTMRHYPIDAFLADIGDVTASVVPTELKRKSRDFFWYSPVLDSILKDKIADVIVMRRGEDDVRSMTYLQCLFPGDRLLESVKYANACFGGELMQHLEFIRFGSADTASAVPVVRYTTPQRLDQIIRDHEAAGIMVANPHVYTLEDGSRQKRVDADQLGFKHEVDPLGLLNPGKMRSFIPRLPGALH